MLFMYLVENFYNSPLIIKNGHEKKSNNNFERPIRQSKRKEKKTEERINESSRVLLLFHSS